MLLLLVQVGIFIISTIPLMSLNIYTTMTYYDMNKSLNVKAIEAFLKTLTEFLLYLITMSFYSNTLVSNTVRKQLVQLFKWTSICNRQQHRLQITPLNAIVNTIITTFPIAAKRITTSSKPQTFE
jgi:hypothetical protein